MNRGSPHPARDRHLVDHVDELLLPGAEGFIPIEKAGTQEFRHRGASPSQLQEANECPDPDDEKNWQPGEEEDLWVPEPSKGGESVLPKRYEKGDGQVDRGDHRQQPKPEEDNQSSALRARTFLLFPECVHGRSKCHGIQSGWRFQIRPAFATYATVQRETRCPDRIPGHHAQKALSRVARSRERCRARCSTTGERPGCSRRAFCSSGGCLDQSGRAGRRQHALASGRSIAAESDNSRGTITQRCSSAGLLGDASGSGRSRSLGGEGLG